MTTEARPQIPLESGDHLTRKEFHRRYCARTDIGKAELIDGVVYVPSPARFTYHGKQQRAMSGWLAMYQSLTPGVDGGDDSTVFMADDSEVQPDLCLFYTAGQDLQIDEKGYLAGAPDLVVEITASSASYDLHEKMDLFRRAGVKEYISWIVYENDIAWFHLRDGVYVRLKPDERGVIASEVFPGLRLNVAAMLAFDLNTVFAELRKEPPRGAAVAAVAPVLRPAQFRRVVT
jgi:Uma2 family endonuclease